MSPTSTSLRTPATRCRPPWRRNPCCNGSPKPGGASFSSPNSNVSSGCSRPPTFCPTLPSCKKSGWRAARRFPRAPGRAAIVDAARPRGNTAPHDTRAQMMHDGDLSGGILDAVLDAAVDAIIVCDAAGHIVRANIAAARLFGYEIDSMPGRSVEDLMPESERSRHAAAMERYIRTGEPRVIGIGRDVEGLRADGALFPLHLSVGHARIDDRDYFVAILHDLSRR